MTDPMTPEQQRAINAGALSHGPVPHADAERLAALLREYGERAMAGHYHDADVHAAWLLAHGVTLSAPRDASPDGTTWEQAEAHFRSYVSGPGEIAHRAIVWALAGRAASGPRAGAPE